MTEDASTVELATELTIAWLSNPNTRTSADDVPAFLKTMHDAVANLSSVSGDTSSEAPRAEYIPAVSVRKSLANKDQIISMIDGKPYKSLRRHLNGHGLSPEQYRERYKLKPDYPMVAESYSEARRAMAKKIGLGRKPAEPAAAPVAEAPAPKPRRSKAKPKAAKATLA